MSSNRLSLFIDGKEYTAAYGSTIMQACLENKIEIPRFCYHDKLSIAGNCRMCLIEIEKSPKLVASCAMPALAGMRILTNTSIVKKAREGVLEFLLINHPLDCPICDQGGECDLQDQAMVYGSDRSRFYEFKRGVKDKNLGPLIKTIMTRCIHCTRCVRFTSEVAQVPELGTSGRGGNMEITTYVKKLWLSSYISGNVIDLCPVGALTSKPYAFKSRPWELKHFNSLDVLDSLHSNIRVDVNAFEIVRVLPRQNEKINSEWITDKIRYSYEGLKKQRLYKPLIKDNNNYISITWQTALEILKSKINEGYYINSLLGKLVDTETMLSIKLFHEILGNKNIFAEEFTHSVDYNRNYIFQNNLDTLKSKDTAIFLNSDPHFELPLLALRFSKNINFIKFGKIDRKYNNIKHAGITSNAVLKFLEGKSVFSKILKQSKNPFVGMQKKNISNVDIKQYLHSVVKKKNVFEWIYNDSSAPHFMEFGLCTKQMSALGKTNKQMMFFFNFDNVNEALLNKIKNNNNFIVYIGHHGDKMASHANMILPTKAFTEKKSTFINMLGDVQKTEICMVSPGISRHESEIILDLILLLHKNKAILNINYNDIITSFVKEVYPYMNGKKLIHNEMQILDNGYIYMINQISNNTIADFYTDNVISKNSDALIKCAYLKENDLKTFN